MRMLEIHTAPVWEEPNGDLTVGMYERPAHPPVVGWCNAARIQINGEDYWILLTLPPDD